MVNIYDEKILFYKNVIDNIQCAINKYKLMNILNTNDYNSCIESLEKVINLLNSTSNENIINDLQYINNSLSSIIKNYGIYNFDYLLKICLNSTFIENKIVNNELGLKYDVLKKYVHPISYKIINWNNKSNNSLKSNVVSKNKLIDDKVLVEEANMLECFDLMRSSNNFTLRIHGIKIIVHDAEHKRTLNINAIIDDVILNNMSYKFIENRKKELLEFICNNGLNNNEVFIKETWDNYYNILSIKEYLVYSNQELFNKYIFIMTQINTLGQKTLSSLVQEFIGSDLFGQRALLIQLLLNNNKQEFQYISYLLYDLLSNDNQTNSDSFEQKQIYDSLPWNCKKFFKNAMYKTIEYTTTLSNIDNNKIPLEQQICLMKAKDSVKEKAMQKLKEIKSKSEDSGSKARQYLDGLLKIPFNIYREEYILFKKREINDIFNILKDGLENIDINKIDNIHIKEFLNLFKELISNKDVNSIEILNIIDILENNISIIYNNLFNYIIDSSVSKKKILLHLTNSINEICKKNNMKIIKITQNNASLKKNINDFMDNNKSNNNILKDLLILFESINTNKLYDYLINVEKSIVKINRKNTEIVSYINNFNTILDSAVHGHKNAKNQIERIIGQWINGEKSGYCFGFEGPPGLGKTTLAKKGLAKCLLDTNGESRPFSFIALGGSSNGSILDGHNYTYVGSTWGKIVDVLIENKCMNPVIFIDELDKVSKTEHGKEIIGILTHLIDSTQNDGFQDKYFSNIDLDLSKALFIFSYNDVELIDRILLDRIHRIKFENLNLDDKLIITRDYLLPELYNKFGLNNIIIVEDELIKYIIENYTNEPGVRKLKEILFEIISTINLDLLKNIKSHSIPLIVTLDLIKIILKEKHEIRIIKVNNIPKIGVVNGLWANSYGMSGILHIESKFFHSTTLLDLKLTGMQGDVMKESMAVSKTLALSLVEKNEFKKLSKIFEETKMQGIHIHVPEGATPKDGPSAGAAITLILYSLLTNKKIKNNFALTGEINLQGNVTAIGGLDLKFLGGIKAGVTSFLYPKDNAKDYDLFCEKYPDLSQNYNFYEVEHISQVLDYMLIK